MTDNQTENLAEYPQNTQNSTENTLYQWPRIQELTYFDPPPFPVASMPEPIRSFITAISEATQTPVDLAASIVLSVIAAANSMYYTVDFSSSWSEPLNLYTIVALPPASRKSAVFNACVKPIQTYEREKAEEMRSYVALQAAAKRSLSKRQDQIESDLSKAKNAEDRTKHQIELEACIAELDSFITPVLPKLIADDVTPEMLTSLLCEQHGKMAVLSAEGALFTVIIKGLYSSGSPNFEVLLKAHDGDPLRVDRRGRPSEYVMNPALTIGLAIQPGLLNGLSMTPGLRDRGLLARFLYALPASNIGYRLIETPSVPDAIITSYDALVKNLLREDARYEESGFQTRHITVSPEAARIFNEYRASIEPSMRPFARFSTIQDWAGKLAGAVLRIAANLQLVCDVNRHIEHPVISYHTMLSAISIGIYYSKHAIGVYELMGANRTLEDAKILWNWVDSQKLTLFNKREMHQGVRGQQRFKDAKSVDAPLELLIERGYIRTLPRDHSSLGRPSSPQYEVNPLFLRAPDEESENTDVLEGFEDYSEPSL